MSLNYTKKTVNNFLHPKNVGKIKNADAVADIGNMVCGDQLSFSLKVKNGRVQDVKFLSFGCASNIATASILTERVKGMPIAEAKNFDWKKIVTELGGLPCQKVHCSVMAVEGLRKVISVYEKSLSEGKTEKEIKKIKTDKNVKAAKKTSRAVIKAKGLKAKSSNSKK